MWAGWKAQQWSQKDKGGFRTESPSTGAQLVCLTAACARKLLPLALKSEDSHMGHFLEKKVGLLWQLELGACYLQPPCGGFYTHPSTCTKGRTLHDHFEKSWAQEGTRVLKQGQAERRLGIFTKSGHAEYLAGPEMYFPMPQTRRTGFWFTEAHPLLKNKYLGFQYWHGAECFQVSQSFQVRALCCITLYAF